MWFNSVSERGVYALRGARRVAVNETVQMSRCRFTITTRVAFPCLPDDGKSICTMFKAKTGTSIAKDIESIPGVQLQFAEKGSFRNENNIAYYDYFTPECTDVTDCELRLVDWYACNVSDPNLDALIEGRGHPILRIPGCITGGVQVNGTKAHGPFSKEYKQREEIEAFEAIRSGLTVPPCDRNTMFRRAHASWVSLDHPAISDGFIEAGIAGRLNGSEYGCLSQDVAPIWKSTAMWGRRETIRDTI